MPSWSGLNVGPASLSSRTRVTRQGRRLEPWVFFCSGSTLSYGFPIATLSGSATSRSGSGCDFGPLCVSWPCLRRHLKPPAATAHRDLLLSLRGVRSPGRMRQDVRDRPLRLALVGDVLHKAEAQAQ